MDQTTRHRIAALTRGYADKTEYFVDRLARGLARIAAANHPKPVIVRMSDFKTNEYANLIGGAEFEPKEENPMLGFRGASRYYSPRYREGFALKCRAIRRLREDMGFKNVVVMIPFCRSIKEADRVIEVMAENGLRGDVPTQRCTVHKYRNLLAHAPERLREEVSADYNNMIYATSAAEIEKKRKAFLRKWRLRCQAVADCLEEAGDRLFTFTRLPADQWKSTRTTSAIERLHEEFKRRIKTQTVLPSAETAAMMFWALLASGQISMRKVDGWKTHAAKSADLPIDLAA